MPDLRDRTRREKALALILTMLLIEEQKRLFAAIGASATIGSLPGNYFDLLGSRMASAIYPHLADTYVSSAVDLLPTRPTDAALQTIRRDATRWATQQARLIASQQAQSVRDRVVKALADVMAKRQAGSLETAQEVATAVDQATARIFTPAKAESVAVTEVTGANSAGEDGINRRIEDTYGVRVLATWWTESDNAVCEICGPLHGKPESAWQNQFPGGPPAHPRCRCFRTYEYQPVRGRREQVMQAN